MVLFSLFLSTNIVFTKEKTVENFKISKISIEKVLNKDNFYIKNNVKTYFILFSDIIEEFKNNGINYRDIFKKEDIEYLEKLDKENLYKKLETISYRDYISNKYERIYI